MYVYGLDLSLSNTGVSIFNNDGSYVKSESIDTKSGKNHQEKLKIIGESFLRLRSKYEPSVIVIEQGFSRFNIATQCLFKVHGVTQYIFNDIEQIYYAATAIKKELTGKGNAKKDIVREYILKEYPDVEFDDLDQSDSFAIAITYFRRNGVL